MAASGLLVPVSQALHYTDHRLDPGAWAASLGVSREACELLLASDFIDLHLDLEVPVRLLRYNPARHHGVFNYVVPFFGHTDYPRLREASFSGVVYDIATNPARTRAGRLATTLANLDAAERRIGAHPGELCVVRTASQYDEARSSGKTAMFLSLQGGNALSEDPAVLDGQVGQRLHRITLVHLTTSDLGGTSSPAGRDSGLTPLGAQMIEACNRNAVLVDLAHAGKKTFWAALERHAADRIPIVSHTGIEAVHRHWRNVDDDQIRAIADRGGVVGVMYQSNFLAPVWYSCRREAIIRHLEHLINVGGEQSAAIGTDYDGMIVPPRDLTDVTKHPLLVQDMLERGWSEARIRAVLGLNYLRVVRQTRP